VTENNEVTQRDGGAARLCGTSVHAGRGYIATRRDGIVDTFVAMKARSASRNNGSLLAGLRETTL
jgi:hypothetical protein